MTNKSPYAKGSKLVKSRSTLTKYGRKITDVKKDSEYDQSGKRFTMRPVNSSNIDEIGYKRDDNTLRVKFLSGSIYDYFNVKEDVHRQFINSSSKGKFLHLNIQNKYSYNKVS